MRVQRSPARKSRRVFDFDLATLQQFSVMRQDEAAKALNVAPITLKRNCKRHGYRWPYRTIKAARNRQKKKAAAAAAAIAARRFSDSESEYAARTESQALPPLRDVLHRNRRQHHSASWTLMLPPLVASVTSAPLAQKTPPFSLCPLMHGLARMAVARQVVTLPPRWA